MTSIAAFCHLSRLAAFHMKALAVTNLAARRLVVSDQRQSRSKPGW